MYPASHNPWQFWRELCFPNAQPFHPCFRSAVQISHIFPRPINNPKSSAPFQNHWHLIHMPFLHWRKSENASSGREERRGRTGGHGEAVGDPFPGGAGQHTGAGCARWSGWSGNPCRPQSLCPGWSSERDKRPGKWIPGALPTVTFKLVEKVYSKWTSTGPSRDKEGERALGA